MILNSQTSTFVPPFMRAKSICGTTNLLLPLGVLGERPERGVILGSPESLLLMVESLRVLMAESLRPIADSL